MLNNLFFLDEEKSNKSIDTDYSEVFEDEFISKHNGTENLNRRRQFASKPTFNHVNDGLSRNPKSIKRSNEGTELFILTLFNLVTI